MPLNIFSKLPRVLNVRASINFTFFTCDVIDNVHGNMCSVLFCCRLRDGLGGKGVQPNAAGESQL